MTEIPPQVEAYLNMIETNQIRHCREQLLFCKLVRHVFATETLKVNYIQLEEYMSYQKYFNFKLFPWELCVFILHCCVYKTDGRPRWPDLVLYVGRGAGKNGYIAFECFCLTTPTNGIANYDIDICATSEEQAKTSPDDVRDVLENPLHTAKMRKNFRWTKEDILNLKTKSHIRFRTNNAKTKDGGRPGMVVFDEYHAYENYKSITVFRTGFGKKPHPRSIIATTDGDVRGGPLDDQKEIWMEILKQEAEDNGTLPFMCRLDSESEVDDPDNWVKANPSIIYLPDLFDEIKKEYRDYKRNPAQNTAFIVKRMNLPVEAEEHQITAWENILATRQQVPDLKGKSCVCGIDYASTSDMVGVFLLFKEDGRYYGIHHAWWCTHSVDRNRVKFDLARGVKEGTLTIVDDKEINPELVTGWIHDKSADYEIEYVAIDKYRMTIMKKYLDEIGFSEMDGNLKIVRPSDIMLVQPVIDRIFNNQLLAVGEDALFRWFCWNTKLVPAPNGNAKYEKIEKRARKNDGFMAFVAGMTCEEYIIDRSDMTIPDVIVL